MASSKRVEQQMELCRAAENGNIKEIIRLLDRGVNINAAAPRCYYFKNPLMSASYEGHEKCVKVLLEKGAKVDMQDTDGWTPLMWAARGGKMECMKVLLDYGAQVDMQDEDGWTPLMKAAQNGHWECVKLLLDSGAAVNIKMNDGRTPLMWAVLGENVKCVKVLLDHGAQVDMQDNIHIQGLHTTSSPCSVCWLR